MNEELFNNGRRCSKTTAWIPYLILLPNQELAFAFKSLDSAFQLQEYISLLIRLDVHDVDTIVSVPGKASGKDKSEDGGEELNVEKEVEKERKSDIAVDEACWIYEQLRCVVVFIAVWNGILT